MSKPINDGGMAFPTLFIEPNYGTGYSGMTLRDYFAGQALVAIIPAEGGNYLSRDAFSHAKAAYHLADAMLAAREHTEGAQ